MPNGLASIITQQISTKFSGMLREDEKKQRPSKLKKRLLPGSCETDCKTESVGLNLSNLTRFNQATIVKKSVILFWLLNMTIW